MMNDDNEEAESKRQYILTLCSAIGGIEEVKQDDGTIEQIYCVGDESLACLRDLKKAIRLDSQNNEKVVLNALLEYDVIKTNIVPLILSFRNQRNDVSQRFILSCVELLVPMTWPVDRNNLDDEESEEDPNLMECYRKYKLDLLTEGVFETILSMIMKSVRIPHRDRSVVDHTTIRLGLYLFRNLAAIPDLNISESSTAEQIRMAHMQEALMIRYYESDIIEFLLTIASNSENQTGTSEWNVLVLETLYNILKYVDAKDVFLYKITDDKKEELHEISSKLSNLLNDEKVKKKQKIAYAPTRHNRFGGSYVLNWDGKIRVSHKQEAGYADTSYLINDNKKDTRVGKKRKLEDMITPRKVYQNRKSLMYLKLTAQSFIKSCFNAFYGSILKDMQREDFTIVSNDYARYYFTMKWFLEYHYYSYKQALKRKANQLNIPTRETYTNVNYDEEDFDFALIASAMDLKPVLFCLRHMRIKIEDKSWFDVQVAADCFRQILITISAMAQSDEQEHQEIAEHIQQNLYYEQTSLDLFVDLLKSYKSQSYGYLKAVIMLTHVLFKLLDQYQKGKKMMFVRRKKAKRKSKTSALQEAVANQILGSEDEEEEPTREEEVEYKDAVFKFSSFEQKYINNDVLYAYYSLLSCYADLQPEYIICITTMFHRLMVKKQAEYLFWKLPMLELFNRILTDSHRIPQNNALAELKQFIRYAVRQFFKGAKEYPLLFVEALVPTIRSNKSTWEKPEERARENPRQDEDMEEQSNARETPRQNDDTEQASTSERPRHDEDIEQVNDQGSPRRDDNMEDDSASQRRDDDIEETNAEEKLGQDENMDEVVAKEEPKQDEDMDEIDAFFN